MSRNAKAQQAPRAAAVAGLPTAPQPGVFPATVPLQTSNLGNLQPLKLNAAPQVSLGNAIFTTNPAVNAQLDAYAARKRCTFGYKPPRVESKFLYPKSYRFGKDACYEVPFHTVQRGADTRRFRNTRPRTLPLPGKNALPQDGFQYGNRPPRQF